MIYVIGIVFITSNIPDGAAIMAQNIINPNIPEITEALDSYAHVCYDSQQKLEIIKSLKFVEGFKKDLLVSLTNSFEIIALQLDKLHLKYLIDFMSSILQIKIILWYLLYIPSMLILYI